MGVKGRTVLGEEGPELNRVIMVDLTEKRNSSKALKEKLGVMWSQM